MAQPLTPLDELQKVLDAFATHGSEEGAAKILGIPSSTFTHRLRRAHQRGLRPSPAVEAAKLADTRFLQAKVKRLEGDLAAARKVASAQDDNLIVLKQLIRDTDQTPTPPKWLTKPSAGKNTGVPTLVLSDIHYDEVVDPKQINGVNAYNRAIANARLKRLFTKTVDLLIHHMAKPQYDYFVLDLAGDSLSGLIHDELRETNEAPVSQSILALLDQLVAGIDLLLEHFPRILVNAVVGNHGRWDRKPRMKNRVYENYEWILYQFLAKYYKDNKEVVFNIADGADLPYAIYSTKYILTHGDQFSGGSGIAGALSPLMLGDARKRKRALAIDQPYNYMICGHWHQLIMAKGIIVNGSVKGADEFSFAQNYDFEPPQQALWITNKDWGMTVRWPIILEEPGKKYLTSDVAYRLSNEKRLGTRCAVAPAPRTNTNACLLRPLLSLLH